MLEFMYSGGAAMWVILSMGLLTIAAACHYAIHAQEKIGSFVTTMSVVLFFATLAGVFSDLAAVMRQVPTHPEWSTDSQMHLIIMTGIGESMAPAMLGFLLLTAAWLLMAMGGLRSKANPPSAAAAAAPAVAAAAIADSPSVAITAHAHAAACPALAWRGTGR